MNGICKSCLTCICIFTAFWLFAIKIQFENDHKYFKPNRHGAFHHLENPSQYPTMQGNATANFRKDKAFTTFWKDMNNGYNRDGADAQVGIAPLENMGCSSQFPPIYLNTSAIVHENESFNTTFLGAVSTEKDKACIESQLSKIPLPRTALVSVPGSGNTWMRHLLQQLTGLLTGAIYSDATLKRGGFPGEGRVDGSVVAIKAHNGYGPGTGDKYERFCCRAVLVVRSPYDSLVAEFNRRARGHTGVAESARFTGNKWPKFVKEMASRYNSTNSSWLKSKKCIHVVRYEDLQRNLRHELVKLAAFLNIKGLSAEHLDCVVANSRGNFKRPEHETPQGIFTSQMNSSIIDPVIAEIDELIEKTLESQHLMLEDVMMTAQKS